jgi:membrane fusion protein
VNAEKESRVDAKDSQTRNLFRKEAIENLKTNQYGSVVLARPWSYTALTILFLVIGLAIVLTFILLSTTRKAHTQGVLVPTKGIIRVLANQPGIVKKRFIQQGQKVRAGDVLFVISGERHSFNASTQAGISALLLSQRRSFDTELKEATIQSHQRISAIRQRVSNIKNELIHIESQIDLQERRVEIAKKAEKRYKDLESTKFISGAQVDEKTADSLDQAQRFSELATLKHKKNERF